MKKYIILVSVSFLFFAGSIHARGSYFGGSVGLMSDLNNLGDTIMLDGLDSSLGNHPSMTGAVLGQGCSGAADPTACQTEQPGVPSQVIVPENKLISYKRVTGGIIDAKTNGSMTGLVTNLFYEYEWETMFTRVGASYIFKISGGNTESSVAGMKWLDINWDYRMFYVPVYLGIKNDVGESSSVYAAMGLNYFDGYFQVGGMNMGDIPTNLLGIPIGATTSLDATTGASLGGGLLHESTRFSANGIGFQLLIGAETEVASGDKLFIEINHIFAGGQGNGQTKDLGGLKHMTSAPTYPVTLNGTFFTFGYKYAI